MVKSYSNNQKENIQNIKSERKVEIYVKKQTFDNILEYSKSLKSTKSKKK
jgi:uncharacterized metal-binding protein